MSSSQVMSALRRTPNSRFRPIADIRSAWECPWMRRAVGTSVVRLRPTGCPVLLATALAATLLSSCLQAGTAETLSMTSTSFPTKFRGDWYNAPGPCHRDPDWGRPDRLALQIGATSLNYFDEFEGRLTHIIRQSGRSIRYTAEYSSEGGRSNATETLRLSRSANEMTLHPWRTSPRYYRCTSH